VRNAARRLAADGGGKGGCSTLAGLVDLTIGVGAFFAGTTFFTGAGFAADFADACVFSDVFCAGFPATGFTVGADFAGADFAGADFAGADFAGADFAGADFAGACFVDAFTACFTGLFFVTPDFGVALTSVLFTFAFSVDFFTADALVDVLTAPDFPEDSLVNAVFLVFCAPFFSTPLAGVPAFTLGFPDLLPFLISFAFAIDAVLPFGAGALEVAFGEVTGAFPLFNGFNCFPFGTTAFFNGFAAPFVGVAFPFATALTDAFFAADGFDLAVDLVTAFDATCFFGAAFGAADFFRGTAFFETAFFAATFFAATFFAVTFLGVVFFGADRVGLAFLVTVFFGTAFLPAAFFGAEALTALPTDFFFGGADLTAFLTAGFFVEAFGLAAGLLVFDAPDFFTSFAAFPSFEALFTALAFAGALADFFCCFAMIQR